MSLRGWRHKGPPFQYQQALYGISCCLRSTSPKILLAFCKAMKLFCSNRLAGWTVNLFCSGAIIHHFLGNNKVKIYSRPICKILLVSSWHSGFSHLWRYLYVAPKGTSNISEHTKETWWITSTADCNTWVVQLFFLTSVKILTEKWRPVLHTIYRTVEMFIPCCILNRLLEALAVGDFHFPWPCL